MAVRTFRGRDRRMIAKALDALNAIGRRDARALDPTPTSALSTRVQVFPSMDADLLADLVVVKARLELCLVLLEAEEAE